jgi:3-oxoacyl-[acyl-carrier-protein] synthase II
MSRRVVVTGMAGISPLGNDWAAIRERLRGQYRNAVVHGGLGRLRRPEHAPRRAGRAVRADRPLQPQGTRSMGRVALMATRASELALADAGLLGHPLLRAVTWASPSARRPARRAPSATSAA